jgi:hypothetical protein
MKLKLINKESPDSETLKKAIFVLESATQNADALRLTICSHYQAIMARRDKEKRMDELRSQLKRRQGELEELKKE